MKIYGYILISGAEPNEEKQMMALKNKEVPEENIYRDKAPDRRFYRPNYKKMLTILEEGDLLYIFNIGRLGHDYEEIQKEWKYLTQNLGVDICVIDIPLLDTRTVKNLSGAYISELVIQILSAVAKNEEEELRKRQAEGIDAAKEKGVRFGQSRKELPANFAKIVRQWENQNITIWQALDRLEMSEATFYRRLREHRKMQREMQRRRGSVI